MKTTHLKIDGMSCEGCVASTQRALQSVAGVRAVSVSLSAGRAAIEHDGQVMEQALLTAVTDAGYDAWIEEGVIWTTAAGGVPKQGRGGSPSRPICFWKGGCFGNACPAGQSGTARDSRPYLVLEPPAAVVQKPLCPPKR